MNQWLNLNLNFKIENNPKQNGNIWKTKAKNMMHDAKHNLTCNKHFKGGFHTWDVTLH